MSGNATEAELAARIVEWLIPQGWDVYEEVRCSSTFVGGRADIVAMERVFPHRLWCIETKLTMNLALLEQAMTRLHYFHYVSVATPASSRVVKGRFAAERFLADRGIGRIEGGEPIGVRELAAPALHRRIVNPQRIRDLLMRAEPNRGAAGVPAGEQITPFAVTWRKLKQYVAENNGCKMRDAIEQVNHHYASSATARSCLSRLIHMGHKSDLVLRDGCLFVPELADDA